MFRNTVVAALASALGGLAGLATTPVAFAAAPVLPELAELVVGILVMTAGAGVVALLLSAHILRLKPAGAAPRLRMPFGVVFVLTAGVVATAIGIARSRELVLPESAVHMTTAALVGVVTLGAFGGLIASLVAPYLPRRGSTEPGSDEEAT